MNPLTVAKFGGTSLADYDAMTRCANIVCQNQSVRLVTVSASAGVTNHLITLSQSVLTAEERVDIINTISNIQNAILKRLRHPASLVRRIERLLEKLSDVASHPGLMYRRDLKDELLSFGERMSALIFTEVLRQRGLSVASFDVRDVMVTDSEFGRAEPDVPAIKEAVTTQLVPLLDKQVIVTQGFIGRDRNELTTTLGRGGSDYSAALLAEAVGADVLEIWTDVTGIYTTDPRLTQAARNIPEISFDEAAEMATFGAKVLHPSTLIPAIRNDIKVFVGSSKAPKSGGTWISREVAYRPRYRAIALRRDQTLITIKSPDMLHACGFLANVFSILKQYEVSVDLVTTSEISIAITLDSQQGQSGDLPEACIRELSRYAEITTEKGLSLVAVIGNHIQSQRDAGGVEGELFDAVSAEQLRLICHGASANNVCFLVEASHAEAVVERLHERLLEQNKNAA